jgi:hypothetical protein
VRSPRVSRRVAYFEAKGRFAEIYKTLARAAAKMASSYLKTIGAIDTPRA